MRNLSWLLVGLLVLPFPPGAPAQTLAPKLNLVIVEGDGAINNIKQRTARETIVQVEDDNHRPVAGALVLFELPTRGASAEFPGGTHSLSVTTNAQGRAVARGLQPNSIKGQYQIHITATFNEATASAVITQTNAAPAAAAASSSATGKIIAIVSVAAAAAAGGAYWATHRGSSTPAPTPGTTIIAGTGTVGAPR